MSYRARIKTLEESCRLLESQISQLENTEPKDEENIKSLKNKKADYFNELRRLNKLQWEEDHERVSFDDDR